MLGPTMKASFDSGKGDGIIDLELGILKNEEEEAKTFVEWLSDNKVRMFLSQQYPQSLASERDTLKDFVFDNKQLFWAVYANEMLVGSTGLFDIDYVHGRAELGIFIGSKKYWNKGIATAVEMLVADYSLNNIVAGGLNKLIARALVDNVGSIRALQKVGFREVGIFKKDHWGNGRWYDIWMSELLREDWLAAKRENLQKAGITSFNIYPRYEDDELG